LIFRAAEDRFESSFWRSNQWAPKTEHQIDLKNKTTTEQVKAGMKTAGENLEDAGYKVKDGVTP